MTDEGHLAREVNRLYWGTDASVADIAGRLDISRRALYDAIEPAPAHLPCPECGARLGYRNRTARGRGDAECDVCGAEVDIEPTMAESHTSGNGTRETGASLERPADSSRALLIGGAVLTGVAVGALIGLIGRRS